MSFQTGLSGLNASARNLDVIGHNIANANTTGMKASRAEFAEVYASSLGATGGSAAGIGVQVATVAQLFTQGNLKTTGNQLDLAVNGAGFFQVRSTDGSTLYTRNGEFKLDREGYIITNNGARLQGFPTNESGARTSVVTRDLLLPTGAAIAPRRTGGNPDPALQGLFITANLDARAEPQVAAAVTGTSGSTSIAGVDGTTDFTGTPVTFEVDGIPVTLDADYGTNGDVAFAIQSQLAGYTVTFNSSSNRYEIVNNTLGSAAPVIDNANTAAWQDPANLTLTPGVVPVSGLASFPLSEGQKTFGSATNVYDSQGVAIPVQLYFVKLQNTNVWQILASADNGLTGQNLGTATFDASGRVAALANPAGNPGLDGIQIRSGVANPAVPGVYTGISQTPSEGVLTFPLRLGDTESGFTITQFGSKFGVFDLKQDGYSSGEMTSIDIAENGVILARYSNGVSIAAGQVALGNFRNLQGLQPVNGGYWSETIASGQVVLGGPLEGQLGLIRQSSLEESNVDLTQELVNMIVAQRAYQANAQTIKTQDQVQQTLVNLR